MIDVTDGTNVNVRLGTLESSSQTTSGHLVTSEDMLDGVDSAGAHQRRPAGARQDVQRTRKARHFAIDKTKNG